MVSGPRRVVTSVELRRIRDGARGLERVLSQPKTAREAAQLREVILDGARALQSTDDLGYDELNALVWASMNILIRRGKELERIQSTLPGE